MGLAGLKIHPMTSLNPGITFKVLFPGTYLGVSIDTWSGTQFGLSYLGKHILWMLFTEMRKKLLVSQKQWKQGFPQF